MSTDQPNVEHNEGPGSDDTEWGSPVRIRKGTRRRLESLVAPLTAYPGIAALPEEVRQVFREAFHTARNSMSPDVLVDTAVAALKHMLAAKPQTPSAPVAKKSRR